MTEIAQLFESALRQNRANLLRKAALNTVARMPATMTLRELLQSDAGAAIRELSLRELTEALAGLAAPPEVGATAESEGIEGREVRAYRQILGVVEAGPMTIGQIAKHVDIDIDELRGYLNWMKKVGKIGSAGRARATRYFVLTP